jgi:hypothetical protein
MSQGNVSYPLSLGSIPTQYWPLMLQIFQQRGIDPADIPDFAPSPAPEGEGLPAWQRSNPVYQVDQQSPAALAQAGLQLAQLGQPTQPTWMAQQPQQQMPQGLLSPTGLLGARTDLPSEADRYRGLLAAMSGLGA